MKTNKEYQKPEVEVIEMIPEEAIVAGSVNQIGSRDPGNINIGISNSGFFRRNRLDNSPE